MSDTPAERWLEDELYGQDFATGGIPRLFYASFPDCGTCTIGWTRQAHIDGAGVADVVAVCRTHERVLVIEIKRIADEGAVSQCLRYIGAILARNSHYACNGQQERQVRGAIVAFSFTTGCDFAAIAAGMQTARVLAQFLEHNAYPDTNRDDAVGRFLGAPKERVDF